MRVVSVIGTRPQFIKAAIMDAELVRRGHHHAVVDTGQHYDSAMRVGFGITPDVVTHDIVPQLAGHDMVLCYGDTDSTVEACRAAIRAGLMLVHLESGCRSFDQSMPEERNRIIADRLADLRLVPTPNCAMNLAAEGLSSVVTGDVMLDAFLADPVPRAASDYVLVTIHRQQNTDDPARLRQIAASVKALGLPVVWPRHHRTAAAAVSASIDIPFSPAVPADEMRRLLMECAFVVTDSGGLMREAYFGGVPCVTVRDTLEFPETLDGGWNTLVEPDGIAAPGTPTGPLGHAFGYGDAAARAVDSMEARWRTE